MNEPLRIITMDQWMTIRNHVTKRFEALFNQLHEVDSRFMFLPKSGYIRFSNIIDGTPVGSGTVVTWTAKWAQAYTLPKFSFSDGSILSFDENPDSKIPFNWVNDGLLIVGWKHQLDYFCNKIYSDLMQAMKKEAEMMKRAKEDNIKKAARFYELS